MIWPILPGTQRFEDGKLIVNAGLTDGYFYADSPLLHVEGGIKHKLKLRVYYGEHYITYDLTETSHNVFPLNQGNGYYYIRLYENVSGKKYAKVGDITVFASLDNWLKPFLMPNQMVWVMPNSPIVQKAKSLGSKEKIFDFLKTNFAYDFIKAATVKKATSNGIIELSEPFDKHIGICSDLSGICVAMLRTIDIPAQMVYGWADKHYHAWVQYWDGKKWVRYDPTLELNGMSKPQQYGIDGNRRF